MYLSSSSSRERKAERTADSMLCLNVDFSGKEGRRSETPHHKLLLEFERKPGQTFEVVLPILESERERHSISCYILCFEKKQGSRQTPCTLSKSLFRGEKGRHTDSILRFSVNFSVKGAQKSDPPHDP